MSKQQKQIRSTQVMSQHGAGQQVEHTEIFDDNLLPDAAEIAKLHSIDPNIMDWLKETASKEQAFRHKFASDRLEFVKENERGQRNLNTQGLWLGFILAFFALGLSAALHYMGKSIEGNILGGASILYVIWLFVPKKSPEEDKNSPRPPKK